MISHENNLKVTRGKCQVFDVEKKERKGEIDVYYTTLKHKHPTAHKVE